MAMTATTKAVFAVPVLESVKTNKSERRVTLPEVLTALVEDGYVLQVDADRALKDWRTTPSDAHPLMIVSQAKLKSLKAPLRNLDVERLTEWMAGRVELAYYHIDPLKIDMRAVTDVMSSDYASKRNILPVEVRGKDVVIATSEPFMSAWQRDLGDMLKYNIKVVIANPQDIARYVGEFYNLSRSDRKSVV